LIYLIVDIDVDLPCASQLSKSGEDKIDGIVALIMALARAMMGEGGGSVYEERGLILL
jgi:hypothetical protein